MPLITVEIVAESPHLVEGSGIVSAWCVGGEVSGPASTGSHQPGVSFGMRTPAFDCIPADHGLDNSMLQVLNCKHNAMLTSVQSPRQEREASTDSGQCQCTGMTSSGGAAWPLAGPLYSQSVDTRPPLPAHTNKYFLGFYKYFSPAPCRTRRCHPKLK